jgi:hypothetical protein
LRSPDLLAALLRGADFALRLLQRFSFQRRVAVLRVRSTFAATVGAACARGAGVRDA